ncbi:3'(2'),5'-bisphosphate nucleotidase [Terrimonas sp.]|uniref:3'(2'),5'-bisphosphate nucleotidase CysQ n=1 Tax=Terrimonas sp. TaxID=1914338 RepID=UPI000D50F249|nr:3'(2'),5'-bisphosphate nucleotidase CysQ [Terrimonas sp.]PVD51227.1 3'(2'),5'-bisphosphate nucleotidase [Terrimonas sp.]
MIIDTELINKILPVAEKAGKAILDIYYSGDKIHVSVKADHTPLTIADKASNSIITNGLLELFPGIPILSEEGVAVPYETRKEWDYYWCVDPLDGTKEFIYRRDDFTVNIALMHNNHPVLGIIYAPVYHALYYGSGATGSWLKKNDLPPEQLFADKAAKEWTAIGSRSHASEEEQAVLAMYPVTKTIAAGSSLKFCRIAEGSAHIYYRYGPTMEWDTAAGQAIAESSGAVMTAGDGTPFLYNKPLLLNSGFICKVL